MDAQPNPANRGTPARRDPSADAEPARRKRVFSGIQPTAVMTIGNYFGAVKNWVRLQEEHDAVYCVVDLHAMTTRYDPAELRRSSREMFVALLAAGIDPDKATVFVQSSVPEHTELCWVLATLASLGDLGRMTQFKEKSGMLEGDAGPASAKPNPPSSNPAEPHRAVASPAKPDRAPGPGREEGGFVSSGLLFYPVLQAADILAYRAALVPVGQDQSQHLELSRGLARRFNSRFGHVFPEPETLHTPVPKLLSPADPSRKMSKSLGPRHYIGLFEDEDSIRAKIRSAVTDSGAPPVAGQPPSPGVQNLFVMLEAAGREDEAKALREDYVAGSLRYSDLKACTAGALAALAAEMRDRRAEVLRRGADVDELIAEMAGRARVAAAETLALVREKTGLCAPGTVRAAFGSRVVDGVGSGCGQGGGRGSPPGGPAS